MGKRALLSVAALLVAACGARSALTDTLSTSPLHDAGRDALREGAADALPTCNVGDLSTWQTERFRDEGDYERAAVATSGVPWVALKPRGGNIVLANLGVDHASGIVFHDRIEIPHAPVYPIALDVDDARFVLVTTTGVNWNGDAEIWRIDRADGTVIHAAVSLPPADPSFTLGGVLGLAGDAIVVAYARLSDNVGVIELRDDQLRVVQSMPMADVSFTAVKTGKGAVDVYVGAVMRVHAEAWSLSQAPVDHAWQVIGGLSGALVEIGEQVRLVSGDQTWPTAWPHSQISPPAVVRIDGKATAFSLETELTAVIGHVTDGGLAWMPIESAPGASGLGEGLFPVVEPGRLGLFYVGIEIPKPEQPLRYYGLACP